MKKTKHLAALAACVLALLAAGCDNGMTDAAVAAVAAGQRPGTGSSHVPSMPDGEIDDDGVLTKYTGSETAVVIPDGVTSIGRLAFEGCTSLASVTIPASVTSIENGAFWMCTSLTDVTYGGTLAQWCAMSNDYSLMSYAKTVTMSDGTDLKQVTTLAIPDSVTSIGGYAFEGCTSLASVTIPDSVTSIGGYAFFGCTSLASVAIGNGVAEIEQSAFYWCTKLESVTIPASVTSIGSNAFYGCAKLKVIHFNGTMAQWNAIQGIYDGMVPGIHCTDGYLGIKDIPDCLTMSGTTVTGHTGEVPAEIVIPDGVTEIGRYAFEDCTNLTSVTIPDSVREIGWYAFYLCTSLTSVIYDGTKDDWGDIEKGSGIFYGTKVTQITGKDGVTFTVDSDGNITE